MGKVTHGHAHFGRLSREYRAWCAMKSRCLIPSDTGFKNYGARGITVCRRWLSFENFLADMGECPDGKTLGRINNERGYSKANCRWETPLEQGANTRRSRLIQTAKGPMPLSHACRLAGISTATMLGRLNSGWPPDKLLSPPRKVRLNTLTLTVKGVTKSVMDWARETGLHHTTIRNRIAAGISGPAVIRRKP